MMKRTIILLMLLCIALAGRAQDGDYRPMVVEGKTWKGVEFNFFRGDRYELTFTISGDTIISGEKYKKVYAIDERTNNDQIIRYFAAIQENNRRVYVMENNTNNKLLLYDFNLTVGGDVVYSGVFTYRGAYLYAGKDRPNDKAMQLSVERIDTIRVGENRFRRFYMRQRDGAYGGTHLYWVEGVGSNYVFASWDTYVLNSLDYELLGCIEGNTQIFCCTDFYKEPELGIEQVKSVDTPSLSDALFDLHGRRLAAPPAKGVYIQGGRKRVAP